MMAYDHDKILPEKPQENHPNRTHRYAVGQRVSYAENYSPNNFWMGGYKIVSLLPAGHREPQYQIRSSDQNYDRVVWESQLQEDLGVKERRVASEF
jgi:hypothetical protein